MQQNQAKKDVLVVIIGSIHTNSVILHSLHLNLSFQVSPPNCKKFIESKIFFYQSELMNIEIFKNTNIPCYSTFVGYWWCKWECHNWVLDFTINYIYLKHRSIVRKRLVGEASYERRKLVVPNTKVLLNAKIRAKQSSSQSSRPENIVFWYLYYLFQAINRYFLAFLDSQSHCNRLEPYHIFNTFPLHVFLIFKIISSTN